MDDVIRRKEKLVKPKSIWLPEEASRDWDELKSEGYDVSAMVREAITNLLRRVKQTKAS